MHKSMSLNYEPSSEPLTEGLLGIGRAWPCAPETRHLLHRNVQRFRGGLVFKAQTLCVSLNSRRKNDTKEKRRKGCSTSAARGRAPPEPLNPNLETFVPKP